MVCSRGREPHNTQEKLMTIEKFLLATLFISFSSFLAGCQDELGYLKDEVRYDCNGETMDGRAKLNARYVVNKKSGHT